MKKTILITGGCRSGKSRHALNLAHNVIGKKVFLATAQPLDKEMDERIQRHRLERGDEWITFEEPMNPAVVVSNFKDEPQTLLILDCITLWISNLLMSSISKEKIIEHVNKFLACCFRFKGTLICITNEVGAGIVPDSPLGREFRDCAGEINQMVANRFDEVIHTVAGIPVKIKQASHNEPVPDELITNENEFSSTKKEGLYNAIYGRRDVRHFQPDPIPVHVLEKVLNAAHHAGSVGFMQPWNFIVIDDPKIRESIFNNFTRANDEASKNYTGHRKELYSSIKLEGIREAPINICVTCDRERSGPHVLGRNSVPDTDIFSTCCAVQNLWLAARAEGLGVGWVSILSMDQLKLELGIPSKIVPIAYLCMGYTDHFSNQPLLEKVGWSHRLPLKNVIYRNRWEANNYE